MVVLNGIIASIKGRCVGLLAGIHPTERPELCIAATARIIGIVDAYDAMSCDRPYRPALDRDAILNELDTFAGVQFDPGLAKEFLTLLENGIVDGDPESPRDTLGIIAPRAMARA